MNERTHTNLTNSVLAEFHENGFQPHRIGGNLLLFPFKDKQSGEITDFLIMKAEYYAENKKPRRKLESCMISEMLPENIFVMLREQLINVVLTGEPFVAKSVSHTNFLEMDDGLLYLDISINKYQNLLNCTWWDVTENVLEEKKLNAIVESIMDPHVLLSPVKDSTGLVKDFVFLEANDPASKDYGCSREDLIGKTVKNLTKNSVLYQLFNTIAYSYTSNIPFIQDGVHIRQVGYSVNGFYDVRCIRNNGSINVTWRNVTEKHKFVNQIQSAKGLLEATLESLMDPYLILSPIRDEKGEVEDFEILNINGRACEFFNKDKHQLIGKSIVKFFPVIRETGMFDMYVQTLENKEPLVLDSWVGVDRSDSRNEAYYEIKLAEFDGNICQTWRNITDKVQYENSLRYSEENYRLLVDNASDVIMLVENDRINWVSSAVTKQFGGLPKEWARENFTIFLHPRDLEKYKKSIKVLSEGENITERVQFKHYDGVYHWVEMRASSFMRNGKMDGMLIFLNTVDDVVEAEKELQQKAQMDALTGLFNRGEGMSQVKKVLSSERHPGNNVGLLFCDLDKFKDINDTHGHAAGDIVLKELAKRIHYCIHQDDIAVRLGGDEFMVVLPAIHGEEEAIHVAEKIRGTVQIPMEVKNGNGWVETSVSIGVALAKDKETLEEVMERADEALYKAKLTGRNQVISVC